MNIVFGVSARLRGYLPHEDYSVTLVPSPEVAVVGGSITPTVNDLTYSATTATGTIQKSDLLVENNADNGAISFTSTTPEICTVSGAGAVSYVSPGVCEIITQGKTGRRKIVQQLSIAGGTTVYNEVTAIVAGSLRAYLRDQQIAALAGVTPGSDAQRAHAAVYGDGLGGNGGAVNTGNFIRAQSQPGFTALPLDALDELLAGLAGSAQWRAWISPHHYLTWRGHGSSSVTGQFVAIGGEIVVGYSADAWAGAVCKLLPSNWRDYMPDSLVGGGVSEAGLWTRHLNTYLAGDQRWVMPAMWQKGVYPSADSRRAYQRTTLDSGGNAIMSTGGDSGSPAFVGINGTLVPLGHTAYFGSVTSWWYGDRRSDIDAAMNLLATQNSDPAAGTYAALTVDLSGFTNYA